MTGTVTSYAVSPALPTGLSLNAGNGQLSGTPIAASSQTVYTITASNTVGNTNFGLTLAVQAAPPPTSYNVGFQVITYSNGLKAAVWYPTLDPPGNDTYPYFLSSDFVRNAAQVSGRTFPLIIHSHGDQGCGTQQEVFMEALARAGFIVAAPDHPDAGCNVDGTTNRGPDPVAKPAYTNPELWNDATGAQRRDELRTLTDYMLATEPFRSRIDATRIGLSGYSFGGYTALGLVGAWNSWRDTRYRAVLLMAPYTAPFLQFNTLAAVNVPLMYQTGQNDGAMDPYIVGPVGSYPAGAYDASNPQKYLLEFLGADHFSWTTMFHCPYPGSIGQCLQAIPSMVVMNDYAVAFFRRHLGQVDQPQLRTGNPALVQFRYAE